MFRKLFSHFTFYEQLNAMDCGPTCLRMVARYYGRQYNAEGLRQVTGFSKEGVSLLGISEAAEKIGFRTRGALLNYRDLSRNARLPGILHWDQNHFVVVVSFSRRGTVKIADPARGILTYTAQEFRTFWESTLLPDGEKAGTVLLLEPTAAFYAGPGEQAQPLDWRWLTHYLRGNKWDIAQVFATLLIGLLLQLVFPFLTQSIVDTGIRGENTSFLTVVLVAQLILVFSRSLSEFIRSRLLLQIASIINLSILSDFWIKLTSLPMAYFASRSTGDTLQRIGDHKQIQDFLTGPAINTLFGLFHFAVYACILALYSPQLFAVFCLGSLVYLVWVQFFLRITRKINYQTFQLSARENNASLQLIQGMQEIKLNHAEQLKRWEWENLQAGIFKLSFRGLSYSQLQQAGATLINQGKDVLITFLVAMQVIDGELTLGAMVAIQYIIGQMSGPVEQLNSFVAQAQQAKISLERLNEVHQLPEEEHAGGHLRRDLPADRTIRLANVSFTYPGPGNDPVLRDVDLEIPAGKVTAIVGVSGSGKTTLLKLLLRFYPDHRGAIAVGGIPLGEISPSFWRRRCGVVMQDGYIFNDTIARNIAVGDQVIDEARLLQACRTANILSFIDALPNGFNSALGADGAGISQGQKQRILIARAVYKNPEYIFLDEATNALDANNERRIVEGLDQFFRGRTVVVVAHRLSTVKHADQIVVLHHGRIVETGTHQQLTALKGRYFELVSNQLEMGS